MTSNLGATSVLSELAQRNQARADAFTAEIRRHCADLPNDEVDELTDGLGADLADRLAEGAALGDAAEYAAELRAAAGLPPLGSGKKRPSLRERWSAVKAWGVATPRRRAIAEFFAALAPAWWVIRGLMVAAVFSIVIGGGTLFAFLVLVAAVLVSVQWGRGRWQPNAFVAWLRRLTSIGAILVLLVAGPSLLGNALYSATASGDDNWVQPGLAIDGLPVNNIFAYDCWGIPIDGAQLFDADGQPLNGNEDSYVFDEVSQFDRQLVPNELTRGPGTWNVFPLAQQLPSDYGNGPLAASKFPFEQVPALSTGCPAVMTPEEMMAFTEEADSRLEGAAKADEAKADAPKADPEAKPAAE